MSTDPTQFGIGMTIMAFIAAVFFTEAAFFPVVACLLYWFCAFPILFEKNANEYQKKYKKKF